MTAELWRDWPTDYIRSNGPIISQLLLPWLTFCWQGSWKGYTEVPSVGADVLLSSGFMAGKKRTSCKRKGTSEDVQVTIRSTLKWHYYLTQLAPQVSPIKLQINKKEADDCVMVRKNIIGIQCVYICMLWIKVSAKLNVMHSITGAAHFHMYMKHASVLALTLLDALPDLRTLILLESVRNMVRRSMPMPQPAVGGRPYSNAVQNVSSINMASSSPSALAWC